MVDFCLGDDEFIVGEGFLTVAQIAGVLRTVMLYFSGFESALVHGREGGIAGGLFFYNFWGKLVR